MGKLFNVRTKTITLALTFACLAAGHPSQAGLDRSIERTMDRQARSAIESHYKVIRDPKLVAFVDRMGQRMAEQSGRKGVKFVFKILDTPEVNALALPAGHIYITTGLIEFADSSDEIAAILGHEVAHVAAHHSLSQFKKQFWADVLLGFLGLPRTAVQVGQVAFGLHMLRHSRKDEGEADRLGARYAYAAGYDPRHLKRFMDKLAKKKGKISALESYLSTHPTSQRRSKRLGELAELNTSRAGTALTIGSGYARRHLLNQAVLRYRQAVAASPEDPQAHRALAQAYIRLGETDAAAAEAVRLASLSPGEAVEIPSLAAPTPTPAAPPDVESVVAAAEKQLQQVLSAAPGGGDLKAATEQLATSHKNLADRKKSVERTLKRHTRSRDPQQRDALRRAGQVLRQVEQALPVIEAVGNRLQDDADEVRRIGEQLASSLSTETDPARQAQLARWVQEFSRQVEKGDAQRTEAVEAASRAARAADQALRHLDEALSYAGYSVSRTPSLLSTTGARELAKAEEEAKKAAEDAGKAKSLQASCQTESIAWRLNLKTISTSPQQQREFDALIADLLGLQPEDVSAARAKAGGIGSAILSLVCDSPSALEAPQGEPEKSEKDACAFLLMNALANSVERDLQAAAEWKGGAREESILP